MSSRRILACDVGLKRIGLAISLEGILLPLPPILRKNREQASNALSQILKEREIEILVVGIPRQDEKKLDEGERGKNEEQSEMERRIRHFISLLSFTGEIFFVDETLSSKLAEATLLPLGKKERKEKIKNGELDSLAAMEILARYCKAKTI